VAMPGAKRRQWQALVKLRNVAVAHSGRSLRAGQKRLWTGVALVRIGDGQSFTRAPCPETFLIPLKRCELLIQDTSTTNTKPCNPAALFARPFSRCLRMQTLRVEPRGL